MTRELLAARLGPNEGSLPFFALHNPIVRHVVLRRRKSLEDRGLLPRIAIDVWPHENQPPSMFEGKALRTSFEFDEAYEAVEAFTNLLGKRKRGAGFMRDLLRQRICSSVRAGISTAERLLANGLLPGPDERESDDYSDVSDEAGVGLEAAEADLIREVIRHLRRVVVDPKFEATEYFLLDRGWLENGCIVFSQYYDTAHSVASQLTVKLREETIALYAGMGKSGVFQDGQWREVGRDDIKVAVRDKLVRLVVATDAASEGLNLQALGSLINVDLPWNPSRLEQRIGRIKRIGQVRERLDMLNLVYAGTIDERIYDRLSSRMKDRYDLLGGLPDVLSDRWIENIERLDEYISQFIERRKSANAFDVKYEGTIEPNENSWALCEKVLARSDVIERMSRGW